MKALKIIGLVVAILIVLAIVGFMVKSPFDVNRSVVINAPNEVIFEQVSHLEKMNDWSPWSEYDPEMKTWIEGTDGEVGAISYWEGNKDVGKGSQELIVVEQGKRVESKLVFMEPWESESVGYITLEDTTGGIKVTWGIRGESPMLMNMMMDMDAAVGKDFDKGLSNLKALAEKKVM